MSEGLWAGMGGGRYPRLVLSFSTSYFPLSPAGGWQGGAIGETTFAWRLVSSGEISLTSLWFSLAPSAGDHD